MGTLNKDLCDKEGGKTGIKFYVGDVLYGKLRPYLMNWLYPQFNGVAVGDFWVLRATECDSSFLYRLVQTDSFQRLANVSSGSKMPRADWNLISQSYFAVPADHAEQTAIAKSLAELDKLITLHQRMCPIFSFCAHGSRTNFAQTLQGWLRVLRYPRPIPKMLVSPSAPASGVFGTAKGAFICASSSAESSTLSPRARKSLITSSILCCRDSLSSP